MDGFEEWTRSEISRLRAEADALEKNLERFSMSRPGTAPRAAFTQASRKVLAEHASYLVGRKRRSKNDVILDAINQAGPSGLSLDEIVMVADRAGVTSNRNTIRSFCWNEKQHGRLTQPDVGRFASSLVARDEAAGSLAEGEPAASDTSHHAESARGGGT